MTQQSLPPKPLPAPQQESDFYWQKCKAHELWLRRCQDCGRAYFYPRDLCPHCHSRKTEWTKASGRGTIHAFSIVHRAPHPAFQAQTPYITGLVQLEEGAIMPSNIVGVEPDSQKVRVGMPVDVVFEDVSEAISLPKFRVRQ